MSTPLPARQMGMVVPAWAAALATAVARPAAPPEAVAEAEAWAKACRVQRGSGKQRVLSSRCWTVHALRAGAGNGR